MPHANPPQAAAPPRPSTPPRGQRSSPWLARYTTGAKYEQHAELVHRIISAADGLVVEALRLADADQHAFQGVIDSYKLPTGTEDLKAARTASIQDALILAAQTPAQLIKLAGAVVDLATELFEVANANVISDIAAAADAARAAATTARVNIDINVVAIKDAAARSRLADQTDGLEEKVDPGSRLPREARARKDSRLSTVLLSGQNTGKDHSAESPR